MGELCHECGLMHPRLQPGVSCPMAQTKKLRESGIDISDIITSLTNIITSQMSIKGIKNTSKIKGQLIIGVTKILEDYRD